MSNSTNLMPSYRPTRSATLAQMERAARVPLRDARMVLDVLTRRLDELRALDARSHALLRDASGTTPGEYLLSLVDACIVDNPSS